MQIVLTHAYFLSEDPKEQEIMRPYPPLGLLYLSAWLKTHAYHPEVVDSTFLQREEWLAAIREKKPKILACYANLMTKVRLLELIHAVREIVPDCVLVAGGPDVSYNVENYLHAGFDAVISGEGEQSLLELVQAVDAGKSLDAIPGISYLENGQVRENPAREKMRELNALPFPDRDAIPFAHYLETWQSHHGLRTANISTQRGCPYTCKWCSTAVYGQSYRRNSPERVVEEILLLKEKFQVEALWFVDDVFTVSHKWLASLHAAFQRANLTIPFECITRAERLNDEILSMLKAMGCFRIWIGAESGSQRIIDRMDRRVELKNVQEMMQKTQCMGMEAGTFLMVGYPGETHDDVRQSLDHLRKASPSLLTITRAYPIKGTALYAEVENTLQLPDWKRSTDRDLKIPLPYNDAYYRAAIRYLVNGWKGHRNGSWKARLKSHISYGQMLWQKMIG
jgi:radical SAM superfamily enzyme YgiQ (UPF0313 family)